MPWSATQPDPRFPGRRGAPAAEILGVAISNAEKPLWPAGKKEETPIDRLGLARYFKAVGSWILPYVSGRPCSILRAPDGLIGAHSYQRHPGPGTSDLLDRVEISGSDRPFLQIDRFAALIAIVQDGGLELHPWNCRPNRPEVPGRLVFDLDPGPGLAFSQVVYAAREMKERLEKVGLNAFCKTSGGKGLHLVVPLSPALDGPSWSEAKSFSERLCRIMARANRRRCVTGAAKKEHPGRIFLDYLRNEPSATTVALLSPRARFGATVSMPLDWTDVTEDLDPKDFTLRNAPTLLEERTPWAEIELAGGSLRDALALMPGDA